MPKYLRQEFHRQADDVRFAAFLDMDPTEAVLVSECAGFAFPLAGVEVLFNLGVGKLIHVEFRDGDLEDGRGALRKAGAQVRGIERDEAQASEYAVIAAPEAGEHGTGIVHIAGLAEDQTIALGDGIGRDDDTWRIVFPEGYVL